ncbi:MAG: ankyrin repeat domain-containing protein [Legionella sp.]|nr:ankyrin repeat domain-containing protein [Legionella sp.]
MAHTAILQLASKLGYINENEMEGLCHGVTLAWVSACMINEEEAFLHRIERIEDDFEEDEDARLHLDILEAREAVKRKEQLTDIQEKLLEIPAFLEQVVLHQKPHTLDIFNDHTAYSQRPEYIAPISKIASSKAMEALEGLSALHPNISIDSVDDIAHYLAEIEAEIVANGLQDENKIALLLGAERHAIGLIYEPNSKRWSLMNINGWPRKQFHSADKQAIAQEIFTSFTERQDGKIALQSTIVTTTKALENKKEKFEKLDASLTTLASNRRTKEFFKNEQILDAAALAASLGDIALIKKMAESEVDLTAKYDGQSLAIHAAMNGQADVIKELVKHKIDLDQPADSGLTATHAAARKGHVNVIRVLGEYKADLNKVDDRGRTPIIEAVEFDRGNAIAELALNHADLDKANNQGTTPLWWAAATGKLNALNALADHGADLNKPCAGTTPFWIAAGVGKLQSLTALASKGADINKPDKAGVSPLFLAAQDGRVPMVQFLLQQPSIQKTPFISTRDSLTTFASDKGGDIMERMKEHIKSKLQMGENEDQITTTPEEIAHIMGQSEVVAVFKSKDILPGAQITDHYKNNIRELKQEEGAGNSDEIDRGSLPQM